MHQYLIGGRGESYTQLILGGEQEMLCPSFLGAGGRLDYHNMKLTQKLSNNLPYFDKYHLTPKIFDKQDIFDPKITWT